MKATTKYRVIYKHRDKHAISTMCSFFSVSHSGYYDFVGRIDKPDRDEALKELIEERRAQRYGQTLGCCKILLYNNFFIFLYFSMSIIYKKSK